MDGPALDLDRLRAIAQRLGETPQQVARTLLDELEAALTTIDAELGRGDLEAVGHAAHAAQTSALMLDAGPTVAALRALETAASAGDAAAAQSAHRELSDRWPRLAAELRQAL